MRAPREGVRLYVHWLAGRTAVVLAGSVLLAIVAATSLLRLEFDVGLVSMLPRGTARFADYERFVERFSAQDLVLALVRGREPDEAARYAHAFARSLRRRPEILEVRARVDPEAFLQALGDGALPRLLPRTHHDEIRARLSPDAIRNAVAGLKRALTLPGVVGLGRAFTVDPLGLSGVLADALAGARPDRSLDPGAEILTSPDGRSVLVLIRPAADGYDLAAGERLAAVFAEAEEEARLASGATASVGYTGAYAYAREDAALLRSDIALYVVLALIGVLAVFYVGYRDLRILPFVTYHLGLTTLVALALGVLLLGRLNLLSLSFAAIFYGLGIDAAIHFYTRFLEERAQSEAAEEGLARTIAALWSPMLLATATTAVAFLAVGLSSLRGVSQLGMLTAVGLVLNVPSTFVVMAALLLRADRRGRFVDSRPPSRARWLGAVAGWVAMHRRVARGLLFLLLAGAAVAGSRTSVDTDLFRLRPGRSEAREVEREIRETFGFTDPHGSVLIEAGGRPDAVVTEGILRVAERISERLQKEVRSGRVLSVTSPSPLLPSQETQRARLSAWAALPRVAAAERLQSELERAGFRSEAFAEAFDLLRVVPPPSDLLEAPLPGASILVERQVERDDQGLSVLVSFTPQSSETLEEVAAELTRDLALPADVSVVVTGRPLMEAELGRTARRELLGFLGIVLVSTGALLWLRERRWWPVLAILAVPIAAVVALSGLAAGLGIPLNPVTIVVLPLTVGIGLDDCLYLVERYRESSDVGEAVARGGRVLSITTATTVAGFGALALSRHPALAGLGALAVASLSLCLVATIVLLPALLSPRWLRAHRSDRLGGRP